MKTLCCQTKQFVKIEDHIICINRQCSQYFGPANLVRDYSRSRMIIAGMMFTGLSLLGTNNFNGAGSGESIDFHPGFISEQMPVTFADIHTEMTRLQMVCPDIVLAQIRLESGHLSSGLMKKTRNMTGMRYPLKRKTTASGVYFPLQDTIIYGNKEFLKTMIKGDHYAVYDSWQACLEDYKLWQDYNFKVREKYLGFIGKVYAEDSLYESKVNYLSNQVSKIK